MSRWRQINFSSYVEIKSTNVRSHHVVSHQRLKWRCLHFFASLEIFFLCADAQQDETRVACKKLARILRTSLSRCAEIACWCSFWFFNSSRFFWAIIHSGFKAEKCFVLTVLLFPTRTAEIDFLEKYLIKCEHNKSSLCQWQSNEYTLSKYYELI